MPKKMIYKTIDSGDYPMHMPKKKKSSKSAGMKKSKSSTRTSKHVGY